MSCGDLKITSYCGNPNCKENPVPIGATAVPGDITGGEGKSILKLFGYYAGQGSSKEERVCDSRGFRNHIMDSPRR